jgi:hypothetical protein
MGQNGPVESSGKHAGKRRAEPPPEPPSGAPDSPGSDAVRSASSRGKLLVHALGVTLCVVAWGYLV